MSKKLNTHEYNNRLVIRHQCIAAIDGPMMGHLFAFPKTLYVEGFGHSDKMFRYRKVWLKESHIWVLKNAPKRGRKC